MKKTRKIGEYRHSSTHFRAMVGAGRHDGAYSCMHRKQAGKYDVLRLRRAPSRLRLVSFFDF